MTSTHSPITTVLGTHELRELIVGCAVWQALRLWSTLNKPFRHAVKRESGVRVSYVLRPFVERVAVGGLFEKLGHVGGGVVGSVARRFFALEEDWYEGRRGRYNERDDSRDLNIVVSMFRVREVLEFLEGLGYRSFRREEVHAPLRAQVAESEVSVTVSGAANSLKHVVLGSVWTGQMNVLCPGRVYSFYPRFVSENVSIRMSRHAYWEEPPRDARVFASWQDPVHSQETVRLLEGTEELDFPCGWECPGLERKTQWDQAVSAGHWQLDDTWDPCPALAPDGDSWLCARTLGWKVIEGCHNLQCDFWLPKSNIR